MVDGEMVLFAHPVRSSFVDDLDWRFRCLQCVTKLGCEVKTKQGVIINIFINNNNKFLFYLSSIDAHGSYK